MSNEEHQDDTLERINGHIGMLERAITDLMTDLNIASLSTAKRIDCAVKLMALYYRALAFRAQRVANESRPEESFLLTLLMQKMRGEEQADVSLIDELKERSRN